MILSRKDFLRKGLPTLIGALLNPAGFKDEGDTEQRVLRPPGFQVDKVAVCRECGICMVVCPEGVLVESEGVDGPVFNPALGSCTFCGQCLDACPHGVLQFAEDGSVPRIGIALADNALCLAQRGGCFTCLERCPVEAIAIEPGVGIRIDTERCNGCGACQFSCPLEPGAIKVVPAPLAPAAPAAAAG